MGKPSLDPILGFGSYLADLESVTWNRSDS